MTTSSTNQNQPVKIGILNITFIRLSLLVLIIISFGCGNNKNKNEYSHLNLPENPEELTGRELAVIYCGSCHLFPEPKLLTKNLWLENVLPNMGMRLGIKTEQNPYASMSYDEILEVSKRKVFPSSQLISDKNWQKIVEYYEEKAPINSFTASSDLLLKDKLPFFSVKVPEVNQKLTPLVTLIEVDTLNSRIYLGQGDNKLHILDKKLQIAETLSLDSPPSDVSYQGNGSLRTLTMGVMRPSDLAKGHLVSFRETIEDEFGDVRILMKNLRRPVNFKLEDLNLDGKEDIIICEFGNHLGKLVWYENIDDGKYKEHILRNSPGAIKIYVDDFNQDDKPDIIALMGQGNEGIFIYYNQGNGRFREQNILQFHPLSGSSHFQMVDFNQDGWLDILYTGGDNADYSFSLKPYHGIRIFLNVGYNEFEEAFFYPLDGATKSIAVDFDKDGDLDIAAIAFFPGFNQKPLRSFIFLENLGNFRFEASTFENASTGRWLAMDVGDIDGDDDVDILLGSFIYSVTSVPDSIQNSWLDLQNNLIILENELY